MLRINFPAWDRELFVYLNSKSIPWLDPIMIALSTYTAWGIVFMLIITVMILRDRLKGYVAAIWLTLGVGMNLLLNNLIKLFFMRPRPGRDDLLKDIINQLEELDNAYSFFSAHSSTSICLALFSALYFRNKYYSVVIFIWGLAVAYSRIYVGKHYPLDVFFGILFGLFTGWMSYRLYLKYGRNDRRM